MSDDSFYENLIQKALNENERKETPPEIVVVANWFVLHEASMSDPQLDALLSRADMQTSWFDDSHMLEVYGFKDTPENRDGIQLWASWMELEAVKGYDKGSKSYQPLDLGKNPHALSMSDGKAIKTMIQSALNRLGLGTV